MSRPRGFGSRGYRQAILVHFHILFSVGRGGRFVNERWGSSGSWGRNVSGLTVVGESVVVAPTDGAVREGGGTAVRDGLIVSSLWAGGILAPMRCLSMVKGTVGARWVLLCAAGGGVAEAVTVGALCVAIGLNYLFDFEAL